MMENDIEFVYLEEKDIDTPQYISFLEKYHGQGAFKTWGVKMHWYFNSNNYRVLVAKVDGQYAGQSTSYMAKALVRGEEKEIWWSVDTFVLEEMRGRSLGRKLQQKLHKDLPNFSSVAYASLNGIIKKKCGAKNILDVNFKYYPISCYFSILFEMVLRKAMRKEFTLPHIKLPNLYMNLNRWFGKGGKQLTIEEISREQIADRASFLMEECLKEEEFHIIRSREYLKWKYSDNPNISFKAFIVKQQGEEVGIVVLSDLYEGTYLVTKARVIKVYDFVLKKDCGVTRKQVLNRVLQHQKILWNQTPDGILAIQNIPYYPHLTYPRNREFLSTLEIDKLSSGYFGYIDQDMESMS